MCIEGPSCAHHSQADREQLTQLLFEQFNLNGLFLADQPVLNLYSIGKTTGLVIDLGHGKTGEDCWRLLLFPLLLLKVCPIPSPASQCGEPSLLQRADMMHAARCCICTAAWAAL